MFENNYYGEKWNADFQKWAELGKKTQKAIPNSKLVEVANTGHLPHIESFDQFIKPLIVFLKQ